MRDTNSETIVVGVGQVELARKLRALGALVFDLGCGLREARLHLAQLRVQVADVLVVLLREDLVHGALRLHLLLHLALLTRRLLHRLDVLVAIRLRTQSLAFCMRIIDARESCCIHEILEYVK